MKKQSIKIDRKKLPKCGGVSFEVIPAQFSTWWMFNRLANAGRLVVWRFEIVFPLPWKPSVAAMLHPQCVKGRENGTAQ